mgnify:CR=1 FL=1
MAGLIMIATGCRQNDESMEKLKKNIEAELQIPGATIAVAFKNIETGEALYINERTEFHAASTMKTPVLIELYKQAEAGKISLEDSITVENKFKSIVDGSFFELDPADDSEKELYKKAGEKESIGRLAYEMIIRSSNLATNLLIELVSPGEIMNTMHELGVHNLKVLRGVEDNKAFQKGMNNVTNAADLAKLFELMAGGQLISPRASNEMIQILLDQQFKEIIPAGLPADVKVAHKTGSITGIQHDSGIVLLPDGRKYVLVLLSRFDPNDEQKVITALAKISSIIYQHVTR